MVHPVDICKDPSTRLKSILTLFRICQRLKDHYNLISIKEHYEPLVNGLLDCFIINTLLSYKMLRYTDLVVDEFSITYESCCFVSITLWLHSSDFNKTEHRNHITFNTAQYNSYTATNLLRKLREKALIREAKMNS